MSQVTVCNKGTCGRLENSAVQLGGTARGTRPPVMAFVLRTTATRVALPRMSWATTTPRICPGRADAWNQREP